VPSSGSGGAKNTKSLVLALNKVTAAETGTGEKDDIKETEMSEASTARILEENRVTDVPPVVETTDGDTKSMEGIGSVLGSTQYVSEQMSSWTGCSIIFRSNGMRPREEQKVSKLQGRTYENGKCWNDDTPIVTDMVALPSKMAAGAVNTTEKRLLIKATLDTEANTESNRPLTFAILSCDACCMFKK
jgi:hypothetical protein